MVKSSQKFVCINKFGVLIGYDFGNRLDASGLLRLERADGDVRVLRIQNGVTTTCKSISKQCGVVIIPCI